MSQFLTFTTVKQRRSVVDALEQGILVITFQKDDGTRRSIRFTLDRSLMPANTIQKDNSLRNVFLVAYDIDARSLKTVRWNRIFSVDAVSTTGRGRAVPVGQPDPSLSAINAVSNNRTSTPTRAQEIELLADLTKIGFVNGKPVTNAMLMDLANLRVERATARLAKELQEAKQTAIDAQNQRRSVLNENDRLKNQLITAQNTIGRVRNLVI